jgi:enoyl-CoA hydratase/carnithine racemase
LCAAENSTERDETPVVSGPRHGVRSSKGESMRSYENIAVQLQDEAIEITLNRPKKRNSMTLELIQDLIHALREVEVSEARTIILGAAGPAFSAGHDFHDMLAREIGGMRELMHECSLLMQLVHRVPQPVIASVQGPAIGAGCQLALSCDMVVASENAIFRTPGGSGGWHCFTPMVALARAVGRKRALEMLMTGDPITSEQALAWGMINRVVPAANLLAEARTLAARCSRGNRFMQGLGKHAFYTQIELDESKAYEYGAEVMASTGMMPSAQGRMRAFIEKRAKSV